MTHSRTTRLPTLGRALLACSVALSAGLFQGALGVGCTSSTPTPNSASSAVLADALQGNPSARTRADAGRLGAALGRTDVDYLANADWRRFMGDRLLADAAARRAMNAIAPAARTGALPSPRALGVAHAQDLCATVRADSARIAAEVERVINQATPRGAAAHTLASACAQNRAGLSADEAHQALLACLAAAIEYAEDSFLLDGGDARDPATVLAAEEACVAEQYEVACTGPEEPGCVPAGMPEAACAPDATRCADGAFVETCGADGNWGLARYCGDGVACAAGSCGASGADAAVD